MCASSWRGDVLEPRKFQGGPDEPQDLSFPLHHLHGWVPVRVAGPIGAGANLVCSIADEAPWRCVDPRRGGRLVEAASWKQEVNPRARSRRSAERRSTQTLGVPGSGRAVGDRGGPATACSSCIKRRWQAGRLAAADESAHPRRVGFARVSCGRLQFARWLTPQSSIGTCPDRAQIWSHLGKTGRLEPDCGVSSITAGASLAQIGLLGEILARFDLRGPGWTECGLGYINVGHLELVERAQKRSKPTDTVQTPPCLAGADGRILPMGNIPPRALLQVIPEGYHKSRLAESRASLVKTRRTA